MATVAGIVTIAQTQPKPLIAYNVRPVSNTFCVQNTGGDDPIVGYA